MELTDTDFNRFREFVHGLCGLIIPDEKRYLITHRLMPILTSVGCSSWSQFYDMATTGQTSFHLRDQIISAMTTNETSFFRDDHPFEVFKNHIVPKLGDLVVQRKSREIQRKGSKVRIWSAASSTGQEPYTMAMIIHEYAQANRHRGVLAEDFSILATDISSRAPAQAIAGEYSKLEMSRGLPAHYSKYFFQQGDKWLLSEQIKTIVEFKKLNLIDSFLMLGGFDFIICRNVLIYFDDDTKRKILDQFHQMLPRDSYLVLGTSEGLYGLTDSFSTEQVGQTILYHKS